MANDSADKKSTVKWRLGLCNGLLQRLNIAVEEVGERGVKCIFFNTIVETKEKTLWIKTANPAHWRGLSCADGLAAWAGVYLISVFQELSAWRFISSDSSSFL
ncbi:hypothetical protein SAMN04490186_0354 [Pseudomonas grimontii]|uniref:Uncharacterized protein n=1 Tax=Pseudomonas grimontii TaxID=129847 RepID=A0ABY0T897_9PSED|nr:hypothetical protein SAMN04490186_0354 [Pseudomonas grimontii]